MKSIPSSLKYKKRFLRWFMNNQLDHDSDVNWFIEDLLADENALNRMHFVENVDASPKGMIISTLPGDESFIFFKGAVVSHNVYTAYHELQLYSDEPFYVQLKFPHLEKNRLYQMLLRDERTAARRDKAIAAHLLEHLIRTEKEELILKKIDWALDTKNKEMFRHYSEELKRITMGES